MKYIIILGDGMADCPVPELDGRTPLQAAAKPSADYLARKGTAGTVRTISPEIVAGGNTPGSDIANMSVLGYDPLKYYTGRAPIEAVAMGISLGPADVAVRCNLVTLSDEDDYGGKTMIDYSSDEITSEEAAELIATLQGELGDAAVGFHAGKSYRHCIVWKNGKTGLNLTAPHDILEERVGDYLPRESMLLGFMIKSHGILKRHPVNLARMGRGLNPANSVWLWGEGTKLTLPGFRDKYGLDGSVISAVDLLKGIAISAGMNAVDVPGATGNIHTDYTAKKDAAVREFRNGKDFVYLHIEAPDECGHRHEIADKVRAIELIDEKVLTPLIDEMRQFGDYKMLFLPDHPTPLSLRTHTAEPVPFVLYDSRNERDSGLAGYDEEQAAGTGIYFPDGSSLMGEFIGQ